MTFEKRFAIINGVVRSARNANASKRRQLWGISSAGRALAWHARGHRFDPGILHHKDLSEKSDRSFLFSDCQKNESLPYCVCRGDHWSPANLPQQRIFRDSFLQGKRARASNARPYKSFSTVCNRSFLFLLKTHRSAARQWGRRTAQKAVHQAP